MQCTYYAIDNRKREKERKRREEEQKKYNFTSK